MATISQIKVGDTVYDVGVNKNSLSNYLPLIGGTMSGNIEIESSTENVDTGYTATRTDTNTGVSLVVGSSGINHGVWSDKLGKWLIHSDGTNVYVNNLKFTNAAAIRSSIGVASSPVNLYNNPNAAASAAATLSETAANFQRMTIFFKDTDSNYSSVDVWSPNGKRVALSLTWINGASTQDMYQRVRWVTISDTTISTFKLSSDAKYRTGQVKLNGSTSVINDDYLAITHVIGYK